MKKVIISCLSFLILISIYTYTFAATSNISSSSTWSGGTITEDTIWNFTNGANITLNGSITITSGVKLTLNGHGKFTRASGNLTNALLAVEEGGTLVINGKDENNHFIIDGNSIIAENSAITSNGTLKLNYTTVCNNKNRKQNSNGGGIYIGKTGYLEMSNSKITKNTACRFGGGFYSAADVDISNSEISYNNAMTTVTETASGLGRGGGFLLTGEGVKGTLVNVNIHDNAAMYYGGAMQIQSGAEIYFDSGEISNNIAVLHGAGAVHLTASAKFTMDDDTYIKNNSSRYVGGAIHSSYGCVLNLNGGEISGNTVVGRGGGININLGGDLLLNGTNIINNSAISGRRVSCSTVDEKGDTWTEPTSTASDTFTNAYGGGVVVDSGTCTMIKGSLSNNFATAGGGGIGFVMIAVGDKAGSENLNKIVSFKMDGGVIENNRTDGNGGGIYLMENTLAEPFTDSSGKVFPGVPGTPTITLNNGYLFNNYANENGGVAYLEENTAFYVNGNVSLKENSAGCNGGVVYIEKGTFEMNAGTIEECYATENGGAVYLADGNFIVDGGSIGRIEDERKLGCRATKGGAAYIAGGTFTMNGGTIEGNTATNSGGGIQISDGNVYITGGKLSSNVARGEKSEEEIEADVGYGGGIYVDGGEIVSITGGEISKNVAAKNGGGIEIKTDKVVTIDVYSGSFIDNVADDCGGAVGIDCDNGTINVGKKDCDGSNNGHVHPVLLGNLAGKQGGGFYMSGKDAILNIYCGSIDNNIVVSIENNFDQSSGTVTVYDGVEIGEENEGVIVIGGTFIDKRNQDEEIVSLIYYCNFENSEDYKQAVVTKDASITLPADIFGVEDYEIVGWTTHKYNTMDIEYRAGEIIEVTGDMELYAVWVLDEKNEPTYMIVIPSEIKFNSETNTMIFDIEATLNLFPRTKLLNVNVAEKEYKLKYYENGLLKDSISYDILRKDEKIGRGEIAASFNSDTALISYEGKESLTIVLTALPEYIGRYEGDMTFFVSIEEL